MSSTRASTSARLPSRSGRDRAEARGARTTQHGRHVGEFFPSVPEDKRGITVRQLMKHRAGLPEYLGAITSWSADRALERILRGAAAFSARLGRGLLQRRL